MIPYGRQDITQSDIDSVVDVLKSDFLTQGPMAPRFEQVVADYVGARYSFAVNSATSALHIACLALDLKRGDWLWTSPVTFVASANCGLYCGAQVDFVDIDPITYNISISALQAKLELAKRKGRLPKILVAVHLAGQPCDLESINRLAEQYGFKVIEDASHAIGGRYNGGAIGNCRYSDITVFSFHPVKVITTAEGGMALTNNSHLAEKMNLYRSHGVTRDPTLMTHEPDGPWYYQQVALGFNYRMTELQAALGVSQMQRVDSYVSYRHQLATRYDEMLEKMPVTSPSRHPRDYSGMHLYIIRLNLKEITKTHVEFFQAMRTRGVGVNLHYIPVHTQPFYQKMGFRSEDFPEAMNYYRDAISLPLHQTMTFEQQNQVVAALNSTISD